MIGKAIAYYREKKNLSKLELALSANISAASVTLYENGKRNPSDAALESIAKVLGVSVSDLRKKANALLVDDDRPFHHKLDLINQNNDVVLELADNILLAINARLYDLPFEHDHNNRMLRSRRISPIGGIVENVIKDFMRDHSDEISDRILDELQKTEVSVNAIIENFRNQEKNK